MADRALGGGPVADSPSPPPTPFFRSVEAYKSRLMAGLVPFLPSSFSADVAAATNAAHYRHSGFGFPFARPRSTRNLLPLERGNIAIASFQLI